MYARLKCRCHVPLDATGGVNQLTAFDFIQAWGVRNRPGWRIVAQGSLALSSN